MLYWLYIPQKCMWLWSFYRWSFSLSICEGWRRLLGIIIRNEVYSHLQRELSVCNQPAERRTADICFLFPNQESRAARTDEPESLCCHGAQKLPLSWEEMMHFGNVIYWHSSSLFKTKAFLNKPFAEQNHRKYSISIHARQIGVSVSQIQSQHLRYQTWAWSLCMEAKPVSFHQCLSMMLCIWNI